METKEKIVETIVENETPQTVYKDFIGKYQISKTLRFKLKPLDKELKPIDTDTDSEFYNKLYKAIVKGDEELAENYKRVKEIIDEMHRDFIKEVLSNKKTLDRKMNGDSWVKLAEEYKKDENKKKDIFKNQRENFVSCFEESALKYKYKDKQNKVVELEKYEALSNQKSKLLIDFISWMSENLDSDDIGRKYSIESKDKTTINSFKGKVGYFDKLMQARANMYVKDAQDTAIANRAINENFVKFIGNVKKIEKLKAGGPEYVAELSDIEKYFALKNYNAFLSPDGIDDYNRRVGKLNSKFNEDFSKLNKNEKKAKEIKLEKLWQQIMFSESLFSKVEKLKNDKELCEKTSKFFKGWNSIDECGPVSKTIKFLESLRKYDNDEKKQVKVNAKNLWFLARLLPKFKTSGLNDEECQTGVMSRKLIIEALEIGENSKKDFELNEIIKNLNSKYEFEKNLDFETIVENAINLLKEITEKKVTDENKGILENIAVFERLPENVKQSEGNGLLNHKHKYTEAIFELFNSVKEAEKFRNMFGIRKKGETQSNFQTAFDQCNAEYSDFDKLYDLVRNYLTQKPYSTDKCRLIFGKPEICKGWAKGKNEDYQYWSVIFRNKNRYLLGIMNRRTKDSMTKCMPDDIKNLLTGKTKNSYQILDYDQTTKYKSSENSYNIEFKDINEKKLKKLVGSGKLFLFEIYNKDFSLNKMKNSKKNLHTYYWEQLFLTQPKKDERCDNKNSNNDYVFKLDGGAELFYRESSKGKMKEETHNSGETILNKTYSIENKDGELIHVSIPDNLFEEIKKEFTKTLKKEGIASAKNKAQAKVKRKLGKNAKISFRTLTYDITKDKRFLYDQFEFHVPIKINKNAPKYSNKIKSEINKNVLKLIENDKLEQNMHIIGIDRGERNLIYVSVIKQNGEIEEQRNFNIIGKAKFDYQKKLAQKEKQRSEQRQQWKPIEKIKDLKKGYVSQVVHEIADMIIKYNAIVVMENLTYDFVRIRGKFEKNVYHQFEKQLLDKLQYLASKPENDEDVWDSGGIAKGYQLVPQVEQLKNIQGQKGCVFYINPWNTSKIDPTTGFMSFFRTAKGKSEFWKEFFNADGMKDIRLIKDKEYGSYFQFHLDYLGLSDFTYVESLINEWFICTVGKRLIGPRRKGEWRTYEHDLTKDLNDILKKNEIDIAPGEDILEKIKARDPDFISLFYKI